MDIDEMKDRIAHIIRAKNLTAAEFADRLGIQPSNVSHLLSGFWARDPSPCRSL